MTGSPFVTKNPSVGIATLKEKALAVIRWQLNNVVARSPVGISWDYIQTGQVRCNLFFENGSVGSRVPLGVDGSPQDRGGYGGPWGHWTHGTSGSGSSMRLAPGPVWWNVGA